MTAPIFSSMRAMVITDTHTKHEGQMSLLSRVRVETHRRMDGRTDGRKRLHYLPYHSSSSFISLQLIRVRPIRS